ncbi:MAG: dynamin family protein [Syntrophales bacterium]|nr:dynamin family protein [Syntrophales bacterium]MDY0044024.1 dynamin family protein [Syntrophales bacterium]
MNSFELVKENLLAISNEILVCIGNAHSISGISVKPLEGWEDIVRGMDEQLKGDIIRIAVVGAIKSGKSTFVNALLGKDYLKRGAGVVTSIITRVRKNKKLEAVLDLKSWEEVNADMRQAIILFPSLEQQASKVFDIRRQTDREELEKALSELTGDTIIKNETLDSKSVLLNSYLKGFPRIKDFLKEQTGVRTLKGSVQFGKHKEFAGDDSLAVYLKDLELQVPGGEFLDENIEIGDCQGVDSINPHHLAMIQDYLLRTHLILYIISSRTGIRQADIGFLSLIKKMGFMENVLFVINFDFSEHEGMGDLSRVVDRVSYELDLIKNSPEIFTFSALFNLFEKIEPVISEKDAEKLKQWRGDKELRDFGTKETERFTIFLRDRLDRDRYNILLKTHIDRLSAAATNLGEWAAFNREVLIKGSQEARHVLDTAKYTLRQLDSQKNLLKDTLDGSSLKIKRSIGTDIDRFLDVRFGNIVKDIREFVKKYEINYHEVEADLSGKGFSSILYDLFQKFKESLDRYITETINPQLIQFIQQEERKAEEKLRAIAASYETQIHEAKIRHRSILSAMGIQSREEELSASLDFSAWELGNLKRRSGIRTPSFASTLHYTAKVRSEAVIRLGFYKTMGILKGLIKKGKKGQTEEIFAIRDAMGRIKKETIRSIAFHMNDYKENLKFQYLYILTDKIAQNIYETIIDRFRVFTVDMSEATGLIDGNQIEKNRVIEMLNDIESGGKEALERLYRLKNDLSA